MNKVLLIVHSFRTPSYYTCMYVSYFIFTYLFNWWISSVPSLCRYAANLAYSNINFQKDEGGPLSIETVTVFFQKDIKSLQTTYVITKN